MGDLDLDGDVDIADFGLFKGGFGAPLTRPDPPAGMPPLATSAQVPEPATYLMTLMAVALGGLLAVVRRRRKSA